MCSLKANLANLHLIQVYRYAMCIAIAPLITQCSVVKMKQIIDYQLYENNVKVSLW